MTDLKSRHELLIRSAARGGVTLASAAQAAATDKAVPPDSRIDPVMRSPVETPGGPPHPALTAKSKATLT